MQTRIMYKAITLIKEWLIHVKRESFTKQGLFELTLKEEKEFIQILSGSKVLWNMDLC